MNRIFPVLALFAIVFLVVTGGIGWMVEVGPEATEAQRQFFRLHFLMGIAAAMVVMLINGVAVTYFIGTSRWCKEVVLAYRLDPAPAEASARLKRRTFPLALLGMLYVVGMAALGAAADPSTRVAPPAAGLGWAELHLAAGLLGVVLLGLAFYAQWLNICENQLLIQQLVDEVRRIRAAKGLDSRLAETQDAQLHENVKT